MKKSIITLGVIGVLIAFSSCETKKKLEESKAVFVSNPIYVEKQEVKTLKIGQKAPDFNLPGIDGEFHGLSDYADADVLVIVFTCNHCPTAQAYEDRVIRFVDDYKDKNVQLVAISPSSPLGLLVEELAYSDLDDGFEHMKIRAKNKNFNFPYLYDGDNHEFSLKYGPVATPHTFVFDKNRLLQYVGRLDSIEKPGSTNAEDLRSAVDAILAGEAPDVPVTKTFGCSTKWGWKSDTREKINNQWAAQSVEISKIDESGIKTLLKNEDSNKLRLINIWATWCGPCVIEYPEFIAVHRMFKMRDFEFVSISADNVEKEQKVLEFLKSRNSAVKNYLFSNSDKYALIEAIDPDWNGALPYSLLIEPNGNIAWRHQGEVDFMELRKFIVDHKMMGRFW